MSLYLNEKNSIYEKNLTVHKKLDKNFDPAHLKNLILEPAILYIHQNLDKKISLNEVAEMCFISPCYFSKLFYKEIGESFSTYLTNLKINKAKLLLKTTEKSVQEIAFELGFNDTSYFIRRFKKHEGTTPTLFRNYAKQQSNKYKIIT